MIVIRATGSVLERGEENSAYFGNNKGTKYYGGYKEYYISFDSGYKNLLTDDVVNQSQVSQMQSRMEELRELDYQDYLEALATPMPLGAENRGNVTKLGKDIASLIKQLFGNRDYLYNYFAKEINIDCQNRYKKAFYSKDNNGGAYYRYFDNEYGYDLFYPRNIDNVCSLVAMTMLLQYYYRTTLNQKLIDPFYNHPYKENTNIINNPTSSLSETIKLNLQTYLNTILPDNNAASYVNMDAAFDRYFKANSIDCESIHFTSYTNVKAAIDGGHPSIFNTGVGTGYDCNGKVEDVSWHNLIAYGYTTNSKGVLDEFICHAGWHCHKKDGKTNAECAKLYVNKFHALGNLHLKY